MHVMPARGTFSHGECSSCVFTVFWREGNLPAQVLYAVALVPAGFLADRTDRPRMLAGGLGVWSLLTMAASKASTAHVLCQLIFLPT